ncbi:hypothetical protein HYPBUDRAFT_3798 [Hyphopichia burtonii NRRL Y-1933]|uniref:SHSP domain-containing protein n=1 Tax=Hyphopichia burtonii NRRL Y-1933 TaxID=984485 RepID=A0A1E4RRN7_9ASCO|nr:hypothetical protein HYPBUDRAFT_3798 [Hyphopichia burtonii NRRL Y-1933]ODV69871.1 hypothetical protein HYPBUDRAFT_3798 [Hyphopichia burtonii NRRL Y-1933]
MFSANQYDSDKYNEQEDMFDDSFFEANPSEPRSLIHDNPNDDMHPSSQFGNLGNLDFFGGNMVNPFGDMGMGMNMNMNMMDFDSDGDLKTTELKDRYIVEMKDIGGIEGKEFSVDYQKGLNQVIVNMNKTVKSGGSFSSSSSQKSVGFDKPIDYNNIHSEVQGDSLVITVPKTDEFASLEDENDHSFIEGLATNSKDGKDDYQSGYIEDVESDDAN